MKRQVKFKDRVYVIPQKQFDRLQERIPGVDLDEALAKADFSDNAAKTGNKCLTEILKYLSACAPGAR